MQNHCGSLSFKTQPLKIAPFSFHSLFFFLKHWEGTGLFNMMPVVPVLEFVLRADGSAVAELVYAFSLSKSKDLGFSISTFWGFL